jgi:multidrug transporter EmrE-like cation transporter
MIEEIQEWMKNSIVDEIILMAIIIAISESIAQNNIKNSVHGSWIFLLGLSFYMVVGYLLHYAYHRFPLGKLNVIWSCISIISAITIGYFLYDEPFNNWTIYSMILALGAIYCSFKASEE